MTALIIVAAAEGCCIVVLLVALAWKLGYKKGFFEEMRNRHWDLKDIIEELMENSRNYAHDLAWLIASLQSREKTTKIQVKPDGSIVFTLNGSDHKVERCEYEQEEEEFDPELDELSQEDDEYPGTIHDWDEIDPENAEKRSEEITEWLKEEAEKEERAEQENQGQDSDEPGEEIPPVELDEESREQSSDPQGNDPNADFEKQP